MRDIKYILDYYALKYCAEPERQSGNFYSVCRMFNGNLRSFYIMLHESTNPRILYWIRSPTDYEADTMLNFLLAARLDKLIVGQNAILQCIKNFFSIK